MTRVLFRRVLGWALALLLCSCVSGFELDDDPLFACLTDGDCLDGYRCLDKGLPYLYGVCRPVVADPYADGWLGEGESDVDCGGIRFSGRHRGEPLWLLGPDEAKPEFDG